MKILTHVKGSPDSGNYYIRHENRRLVDKPCCKPISTVGIISILGSKSPRIKCCPYCGTKFDVVDGYWDGYEGRGKYEVFHPRKGGAA